MLKIEFLEYKVEALLVRPAVQEFGVHTHIDEDVQLGEGEEITGSYKATFHKVYDQGLEDLDVPMCTGAFETRNKVPVEGKGFDYGAVGKVPLQQRGSVPKTSRSLHKQCTGGIQLVESLDGFVQVPGREQEHVLRTTKQQRTVEVPQTASVEENAAVKWGTVMRTESQYPKKAEKVVDIVSVYRVGDGRGIGLAVKSPTDKYRLGEGRGGPSVLKLKVKMEEADRGGHRA